MNIQKCMQCLLLTVCALWGLGASAAQAALQVLACEPEWAALVGELAGDRAQVVAATSARQDPHRIEARPSLIAAARRADLVVCTGAELETGWLPLLQRESGNPRILPGQPGYFEATAAVRLIERPPVLDRALGDLHAAGNPHVHTDPRNVALIAKALAQRLGEIDPAGATIYADRHRNFAVRWAEAIARWQRQAQPLRGLPVVVHHRNWSYLAEWLGLRVVADLEPKPGIEPSARDLERLIEQLRAQPARMVLRAPYQSPRASDWIAQRSGISAVMLPYTVGGTAEAGDLYGLFDDTLRRLLAAAQ